eukprot:4949952-Pyramimonas_sp.AAC.1
MSAREEEHGPLRSKDPPTKRMMNRTQMIRRLRIPFPGEQHHIMHGDGVDVDASPAAENLFLRVSAPIINSFALRSKTLRVESGMSATRYRILAEPP